MVTLTNRFEIKKCEETNTYLVFDKKKYKTCIHNKKLSNNRFQTKKDAEYCIINWLASRGVTKWVLAKKHKNY